MKSPRIPDVPRCILALALAGLGPACHRLDPSLLFASGELLKETSYGPNDPDAHVSIFPAGLEPSNAEVVGTITARPAAGGCYLYTPEVIHAVLKYKARHMGADAIARISYQECEVTTGTAKRTDYVYLNQSSTSATVTSQIGLTAVSAVALRVTSPPLSDHAAAFDMKGEWDIDLTADHGDYSGSLSVRHQQGSVFHGQSTFSNGAKCRIAGRIIAEEQKIIVAAIDCFPGLGPNSHELKIVDDNHLSGRSDEFFESAYGLTSAVDYRRRPG